MKRTVVIDCFPESALRYVRGYALVAIDVIRAATTIATAVARGRRCFPVASVDAARRIAEGLVDPLCAGELGGVVPRGFEMNNSPADLDQRSDVHRPLVLLSSAGTKLIDLGRPSRALYVGCLRNYVALAQHLAARHEHVALIGAGSRHSFREEDQLCCAWIARLLLDAGFASENPQTADFVKRWKEGELDEIMTGASAAYLMRSGQGRDLEFILSHVADLEETCRMAGDEVVPLDTRRSVRAIPMPVPPARLEYSR